MGGKLTRNCWKYAGYPFLVAGIGFEYLAFLNLGIIYFHPAAAQLLDINDAQQMAGAKSDCIALGCAGISFLTISAIIWVTARLIGGKYKKVLPEI